jgi:hypothetical protein
MTGSLLLPKMLTGPRSEDPGVWDSCIKIAGTCWEGDTFGLGSSSQVMTSIGKCCWIYFSVTFRENLPHMDLDLSLLLLLLLHLIQLGPAGKDFPDIFHGQPLADGISQFLQKLQFGFEAFYHINPSSWS